MAEETAVSEFALPDLGEGLTEAEIVQWLVEVGEVIAVDQPIVSVETAKAQVEVPCPYGGVVTARFGAEGEEVPVGSVLVTVAPSAGNPTGNPGGGSGTAGAVAADPVPQPASTEEAAPESEGSGQVLVGYGTREGAPRRRRSTRLAQVPVAREAPPSAADSPARPPRTGATAVISPLVRRLAREHRIDLSTVRGSGPDGLILRADVERLAASTSASALTVSAPASTGVGPLLATVTPPPAAEDETVAGGETAAGSGGADGGERRVPLRGLRGRIADKLSRSRREIPEATCWVDVDATELLAVREAMSVPPRRSAPAPSSGPGSSATGSAAVGSVAIGSSGGQAVAKVPLLAILARICTAALARYPELNASVDTDEREIVQHADIHLGLAAQTERGLVVPVVRDAGRHSIDTLATEVVRLTEAARAGRLEPGELVGGTFTLNNYGVLGVDGSTPIINHPEAAMLGVGQIVPKPWVHQGELAVRHVVQLSLTFDHRVCDGGTAGGFLRYVADCVERPAILLRGL